MSDAATLIAAANERANSILTAAQDVANQLQSMSNYYSWTRWNIGTPPTPPNYYPYTPVSAKEPTAAPPVPLPPAIQFEPLGPLNLGTAPDVDMSDRPVLNIGDAPTLNIPDAANFIGQLPQPSSIAAPQAPSLQAPQMGGLANVVIPPVPTLNLPTLHATKPVEDFLPLENKQIADFYSFSTPTGSLWASQNLTTIQDKLRSDIVTGGTGIDPDVQQAIFGKAAERDLMVVNDALRLAAQSVGKMGFPMPPGRLLAQQNEILDKYTVTRAETSRTIMVTTAELAQKNIQFAITGLTQIEQIQVQFSISFADRMLNVAKASVDAAIAWFNASIVRYNAKLDAYKTEVSVFEMLLKAEAQKLEIFKGQLEGAKITGDLNMQQVEIYKAKLAALQTAADVYRTQVEAYSAQLGADKAKIDVYRVRADVYQALVQSETAKLGAFDAKVRGETAKVQVFQASIEAQRANIQAYSAGVEAKTKELDAKTALARHKVDVYTAQVAAVRAQNEQNASLYGNQLMAYKAHLDLGIAENATKTAYAQIYNESYRAQAEVWKSRSLIALEEAKHAANQMHQDAQIRVSALSGVTNAYASMASGAMSAVNAVAQTVTQA